MLEMRPELADNPHAYGAPARRMLTRAEAAILFNGASTRPVAARSFLSAIAPEAQAYH